MGDVLQIVHRLRKVRADHARSALALAQDQVRESHDRLRETEARLNASTGSADGTQIIDLQARHQGALQLELQRRAQANRLRETEARAGDARTAFTAHARDAKVVELVAEARMQQEREEFARRDTAQMDEQGLMSWWRRSA